MASQPPTKTPSGSNKGSVPSESTGASQNPLSFRGEAEQLSGTGSATFESSGILSQSDALVSPAPTAPPAPPASPEPIFSDDSESERLDEDESNNSEPDPSSVKKKKGAKAKRTVKEKDGVAIPKKSIKNLTFEPDQKKRTQILKGRAPTIKRLAEELKRRTDAQVYMKIKYVSSHRHEPYTYTFGSDFDLEGGPSTVVGQGPSSTGSGVGSGEGPQSIGSVQTQLSRTLPRSQGLSASFNDDTGSPAELSQESTSSRNRENYDMNVFQSPHASTQNFLARRRNISQPGCVICKKNEPFLLFDDVRVEASFFTCAHEPCEGKIHNDCAGFPGMLYRDFKLHMPWWCPVHRGAGRDPVVFNKTPEEVLSTETPAQSASGFTIFGRTRSSSSGRRDTSEPDNLDIGQSVDGSGRGQKKSGSSNQISRAKTSGQDDDIQTGDSDPSNTGPPRGATRGRPRGSGRGGRGGRARGK